MKLIDRIHRKLLIWARRKCLGNKTKAAKMIGISLRTFRNWEIKYGLRHKLPPEEQQH